MSLPWVEQFNLLLSQWKNAASAKLIGLDIGAQFIKLLEINPAKSNQIENFAITPLPAGAVIKGEIKEPDVISKMLNTLFKENRIHTKNIAFAVPQLATIVKNFTVNKHLNENEIESRTWIEANHHFPDLIQDIYLDFNVVGPSEKDSSQLDVMIVACRKDQINPYLNLLKKEHLNAAVVDVDSYVLERALTCLTKQTSAEEKNILLNLDTNLITLIILDKAKLTHSHQQNHKGQYLTAQVQDYFSKNGITDLTVKNQLINDPDYLRILTNELRPQLHHMMHFFNLGRQNTPTQTIILSGDLATVPDIDLYIEQETKIKTILANPFKDLTLAPHIDPEKLRQHAPSMMLCYGLASRKPI